MSVEATIARHKRREQAVPGGSHDRLIHFLLVALPIFMIEGFYFLLTNADVIVERS